MFGLQKFRKLVSIALLGGSLLGACSQQALAGTGVYVNGIELTPQQFALVGQSLGYAPPPGQYIVYGGCVAHLESGQVFCPPNAQNGAYANGGGYAGGGYGYGNGEGNAWFGRGSDYSGGYSVGGDGSGCIYTPDWSNC